MKIRGHNLFPSGKLSGIFLMKKILHRMRETIQNVYVYKYTDIVSKHIVPIMVVGWNRNCNHDLLVFVFSIGMLS